MISTWQGYHWAKRWLFFNCGRMEDVWVSYHDGRATAIRIWKLGQCRCADLYIHMCHLSLSAGSRCFFGYWCLDGRSYAHMDSDIPRNPLFIQIFYCHQVGWGQDSISKSYTHTHTYISKCTECWSFYNNYKHLCVHTARMQTCINVLYIIIYLSYRHALCRRM